MTNTINRSKHENISDEEEETSFSAVVHSPPRSKEPKPQQARQEQEQSQGVTLTDLGEYVCRKKSESYKDGNGFLSDYEVSDNDVIFDLLTEYLVYSL